MSKTNLIKQHRALFFSCMDSRLKQGKKEYGNNSFLDKDLIKDIEEELVDTANYAFLQYIKLQRIKEKLGLLEGLSK